LVYSKALGVFAAVYAKTAETTEMPFGVLTNGIQGIMYYLDVSQDRTIPLAAGEGDKSAMRPFVKII